MNKKAILDALLQGKKVYWKHTGYSVTATNKNLYCTFLANGYMTALHESEYIDCFVE